MPVTTSAEDMASVTEKPDSASISGSISAIFAANTGSVASSPLPMAAHCEPWPENTHTGPCSPVPTAASMGPSPSAISRSAETSWARSEAMTTVRTGRWARRRASVYARSDSSVVSSASGRVATQSASRPAVRRNSSTEVADSGKSFGPCDAASARSFCSTRRVDCPSGAASSTACTLVPDRP